MDTNSKQKPELTKYALELIHHKARELVGTEGFIGEDVEDIEQSLVIDLLERLPKYNPAKATNNTFVARLVERKISRTVRDSQRLRRDPGTMMQSLNEEVDDGDGEGETGELSEMLCDDVQDLRLGRKRLSQPDHADRALDVAAAIADLPRPLRRIAKALKNLNIRDAGRKLGIPEWKLHEFYLPQIRETLVAKGLRDYVRT